MNWRIFHFMQGLPGEIGFSGKPGEAGKPVSQIYIVNIEVFVQQ